MARTLCSSFLLLLSACAAPVLMMTPQGQLMWALLKPLVGLDPAVVNLWEQPMLKSRMTLMLGERYVPVMRLLRTAKALEQEGPLFFFVSRSPATDVLEHAGLVWNAETNQLAALLAQGQTVEVFAEHVKTAAVLTAGEAIADHAATLIKPTWPAAIQPWLTSAIELRQTMEPVLTP